MEGKERKKEQSFPNFFFPLFYFFLLAKRSECQFFDASPFLHDDVCLWDQKCVAFLLGLLLLLFLLHFFWDFEASREKRVEVFCEMACSHIW